MTSRLTPSQAGPFLAGLFVNKRKQGIPRDHTVIEGV